MTNSMKSSTRWNVHTKKEVHMYHVSTQFKMYIRNYNTKCEKEEKEKNRGAIEWVGNVETAKMETK